MKPTRIAVIGTGHLGTIHTRLWRDFAQASPETVQLCAIYDIDPARAARCASELALNNTLGNILENNVQVCNDLTSAIDLVDAVTIVSPTSTHYAIARECLGVGKHCFIEKPITTTSVEAQTIADIAQNFGLMVHVGQVERFNPAVQAIDRSTLRPLFIEAHRLAQFKPRATDVSVILDLMIHDIDIALWLVHSPVVEVRANGVAVLTDTLDIANVRLQFDNGCVANLTASRISAKQMRKMRLFGRDAYLSLDFAEHTAEAFRITDRDHPLQPSKDAVPAILLGNIEADAIGTNMKERTIWYEKPAITPSNAIAEEQRAFIHAIRGVEHTTSASYLHHATTAHEAVAALDVVEKINAQIEQQRASLI
jgi:predicted dehydrogenase